MHSGGWFARVRGAGVAGSENLPEMAGWRLSIWGFCLPNVFWSFHAAKTICIPADRS